MGAQSLQSCSIFLWLYGLQPARLLCPWDSPGKNTGVGCHFLLQGILPTQGSNQGLPRCRQILHYLRHQKHPYISPYVCEYMIFSLNKIFCMTPRSLRLWKWHVHSRVLSSEVLKILSSPSNPKPVFKIVALSWAKLAATSRPNLIFRIVERHLQHVPFEINVTSLSPVQTVD